MSILTVVAVQAAPLPVCRNPDMLSAFAADVMQVRSSIAGTVLVVYPELHLFGTEAIDAMHVADVTRAVAEPLNGPLVAALAGIARDAGVWLIPGTMYERGPAGEVYNTALVLSPDGGLVGSYRKIFPWRPYEWCTPGLRMVTVDLPSVGRIGLSICYDAWFPELSRHLAWMGAQIIVNVAQSGAADRPQELVLARAHAIVNQVFTVSVNTAGPLGRGCSTIADPEGTVLAETDGANAGVLYQRIDLAMVAEVRRTGTAGTNRMWDQFRPDDAPLELPLYSGRIEPHTWNPAGYRPTHRAGPS